MKTELRVLKSGREKRVQIPRFSQKTKAKIIISAILVAAFVFVFLL